MELNLLEMIWQNHLLVHEDTEKKLSEAELRAKIKEHYPDLLGDAVPPPAPLQPPEALIAGSFFPVHAKPLIIGQVKAIPLTTALRELEPPGKKSLPEEKLIIAEKKEPLPLVAKAPLPLIPQHAVAGKIQPEWITLELLTPCLRLIIEGRSEEALRAISVLPELRQTQWISRYTGNGSVGLRQLLRENKAAAVIIARELWESLSV